MNNLPRHEDTLVASLKAKDKTAISNIYDYYSPVLFGVILKIVKSEQSAEDVLQDAFVKIWKSAEMYDASKGRLFTWLINIARNTAIDHIRSKDFKKELRTESNLVYANEDTESFNTDHIGLKEIVEKLKPDNKEIIDLIYFQGYTHVEVAEKLSLPLGTVKSKVRISIRELREIIT
ncbi:MAG: sigma-70 family RNA polymerase sigma factor [Chitinophagales bacterium]|nr:sigma-70 family RNA polymerase sigma factor [Chitinophagales bacterium]